MRTVLVGVGALVLSGCVAAPAMISGPPPEMKANETLVAAQDYIVGGILPNDHGDFPMYGIVALSDNSKRSRWVCETFTKLPPVKILLDGGIGSVSKGRVTPTYWLLKENTSPSDCDALRDNYDYDRAKALFSLVGRPGESGTLLIAYKDEKIAVLDISKANKKWTKAMVAKWSEAMRSNGMQNISVKGGLIADTCSILTGKDSERVEAAVYEVIKDDLSNAAPWYEKLLGPVRAFAIELIPFGTKIERVANATCDEVNSAANIA